MKSIYFILLIKLIQIYSLKRDLFFNTLQNHNEPNRNIIDIISHNSIDFLKRIPGFNSNLNAQNDIKTNKLRDLISYRLQIVEYDTCDIIFKKSCDINQRNTNDALSDIMSRLNYNQLIIIKKEMDISFDRGLSKFKSYGEFNILNDRLYYNPFDK